MSESKESEESKESKENKVKKSNVRPGEFVIKKENSRILKGLIETLSHIIDEAEIKITPKEFSISAMDPSRICLLKASIKKEDFDEFKCNKKTIIGLNLDDLDKILKRSNTNDAVVLSYKEEDQKIKVRMTREGSERARTFSLALLDIEIEEVPMENLLNIDYNSQWVLDTEILLEAIKDAEIYSEILNMKAIEGEGLIFNSSGSIGEMIYELGVDELIESDINDTSSGAYSLTFLKAILKLASITEKLEISLKTDHPLKMRFELLEGGDLDYFLAPRVEEADFDDDDDDIEDF